MAYLYEQTPLPYYTTTFASRNHCHPLPGQDFVSPPDSINCLDYWNAAIKLAESGPYKRVVFGAGWAHLNSTNARLLINDLQRLRKAGKEIFLIGHPPNSPKFDPSSLAGRLRKKALWGGEELQLADVSVPREQLENVALVASLAAVAAEVGARLINPFDYLCPNGACPVLLNSTNLYIDASHLRASHAARLATFIDAILEQPAQR